MTAAFTDRSLRHICIIPVLGLLIAFNVFPLLASLAISFTDYNPSYSDPPHFTGLTNYKTLLASPEIWRSFGRTGALVAIAVGLQTLIGFGVAIALSRITRGRGALTAILLIPMMLSPAIMASFWRYMLNDNWGLVNALGRVAGLKADWTWDGTHISSFWGLVIVEVWMWTPFIMLLSLAGIGSISPSLYEAAAIDRANPWQVFRHITLPMSAPLLLLGVVFRVMDTFKLFDTAYVLNGNMEGQPTTVASVLLHKYGFGMGRPLGEATALAYLMLIVATVLGKVLVGRLEKVRPGNLR